MRNPLQQSEHASERIAERYRIEQELGRGGMARVVRAIDERSGQAVALKQLLAVAEPSATLRAMFEREYRTLATLSHPHIVRAFDYGFDGDGTPYYTMELLEGVDARETVQQRLPDVQQVCVILRDCAAALALIHSRRMVHRDVSPRNVWCLPDGRAKLIDFGTLVAMGAEVRIAGTPPFVPPEAYYAQTLDPRCDLYGLGALGYFLLTARQAFPARVLADLPEFWTRRPQRPDELRPELPKALCDLVMSLMSLDVRGRPGTASEVYERLTTLAQLPAEHEPQVGLAFLSTPRLVAREHAHAALTKRLRRAGSGRGSSCSIVADAGLGRSRMLKNLAIEAKLSGACALVVSGSALGSDALTLGAALTLGILEAVPQAARIARDVPGLLGQLGHLGPEVQRALGDPELAPLTLHEREQKLTSAVATLIDKVSAQHCLVIAVDDLQRTNGKALGLLGRIALLARHHRLLVVATCDEAALPDAPPALLQLVVPRTRIALPPLDAAQTRELLESLFEDIPELEQTAEWLHELSGGNPQACMQYAQFLVDQGAAKYAHGRWRLLGDLKTRGLPSSLGAMFEQRVQALSPDARTLALGLALARDSARASWQPEVYVPVEAFCQLLDPPVHAHAFAALDELQHAGLVQDRNGHYLLGQTAVADALVRLSDDAQRRHIHARLAQIFETGTDWSWLTPKHLQLAGEGERARQHVLNWSIRYEQAMADWGGMRLSLTAECGVRAIEHWRAAQGSPREGLLLRRVVLLVCSVYDWKLAGFGQEQLDQLARDCGLTRWHEQAAAHADASLAECLAHAERAYEATPSDARGFQPREALQELAQLSLQLSGAYTNTHALESSAALLARIKPLATHSPLLGLLVEGCEIAYDRARGAELFERMADACITRMLTATGLPDALRMGSIGVHVHIQAVEDARRGRDRSLGMLTLLAGAVGDEMFLVVHGRFLSYGFMGQAAKAKQMYRLVELITDDIWRRRAYLFAEAELHTLTGDLRALVRVTEMLETLERDFLGWSPWAAWARAQCLRLGGDPKAARRELERALSEVEPGRHRAWIRLAPSRAALMLQLGDAAGALKDATATLATVEQLGLDQSAAVETERLIALAHAALQDHAAASSALERAFARAAQLGYGGLPLALLHETKAQLAIERDDADACVAELGKLWRLIEHSEAAALIRAYENLRQETTRVLRRVELPHAKLGVTTGLSEQDALLTEIETRLSIHARPAERTRHALELLLHECCSSAGYLFLINAQHEPFEVARHAAEGGMEILALAAQVIAAQQRDVSTVTETEATSNPMETQYLRAPQGTYEHRVVVLSDVDADGTALVGVALAVVDPAHLLSRPPRPEFVRMVSRVLRGIGDSIVLRVDA